MKKKIYFETYGCTLNRADTDIMKGIVLEQGMELADEQNADVIVLNTCTVKETTENKIISRIKSINKPLVVAGCMSVNEKRIRNNKPNVVIISSGAIEKITEAINRAIEGKPLTFNSFNYKDELPRIYTAPILRIPIVDGCLSNCAFCETRFARPGLRSYRIKTIGKWIREGVKKGAKEIQLTGMDTGAYGHDIKTNLIDMLNAVLEEKGDFKIRLGMINPQHAKRLLDGLLKVYEHKKMYKFIHLPVQSGSEKVVKLMNRGHTVKDYVELVDSFRNKFNMTIATDIIIGFPGEEQEDCEQTIKILERTKPDVINISKFSVREHARAKKMKKLDTKTIKNRSTDISDIIKERK